MKLKALVFPIAIGALALLGACSGAETPETEIEQEPGVVEQAPEQVEPLESPGAVPADPMSPDPSSMESPAPTGDVPPAS